MMFPKKKWLKGEARVKNEVKAEKAEDRLWKWFSKYIRLRDCPTGSHGFCRCVTCNKGHHYTEMQAGHYVRRRHRAVKYDERNVNSQCINCNNFADGNEAQHRLYIVKQHGEDVAEYLENQKGVIVKMLHAEVEALATYYRVKAKEEAERVGVEIK